MGRRKIWDESRYRIKHLPSGIEAFYESGEDGSVKGWWTEDSFAGTSIREAKNFLKVIADMLRGR